MSEFMIRQVEVPRTASIRPGSTDRAAAAVTCASMVPAATAMPVGRPVHPAASAVSPPARVPSATSGPSTFGSRSGSSG